MDITVEGMEDAKKSLEDNIKILIGNFEKTTGTKVESVSVCPPFTNVDVGVRVFQTRGKGPRSIGQHWAATRTRKWGPSC